MSVKKKARRYCIAFGCMSSDRDESLVFFRPPTDMERRSEWLMLLGREDLLAKEDMKPSSYSVCSKHFEDSSFKRGLLRGSLPIKVVTTPNQTATSQSKTSKIKIISNIRLQNASVSTGTQTKPFEKEQSETKPQMLNYLSAQTPLKRKLSEESQSSEHICRLHNKNDSNSTFEVPVEVTAGANYEDSAETDEEPERNLTTELNKHALQITLLRIKANPQLYTGIPQNCYHLVELLHKQTKIPTVHILLCLKKVKLDTQFEELADQFGILACQAKQIFVANIPLIADAIQSFITNLDNSAEAVQCNLPIPFRAKHQNAECVVDSLELNIQPFKEFNKKNKTMIEQMKKKFVQSGNGNTVKYLISASPDGFINYVSSGYGGMSSDEMLLKSTNYLDRLKPGSCIVVKRGFKNAEPILSKRGLKLLRPEVMQEPIPGFILLNKMKPVLGLEDHVERVVQRVKEFTMVNGHSVISADLMRVVDDVVVISCALINLQSFVIN